MREDLHLPPGKFAAKSGQALLNCLRKANPDIQDRYFADGEGTQIVLWARDQEHLLRVHASLSGHDYPTCLVIEDGKLMGCGIGPVMREKVCHITKELQRVK